MGSKVTFTQADRTWEVLVNGWTDRETEYTLPELSVDKFYLIQGKWRIPVCGCGTDGGCHCDGYESKEGVDIIDGANVPDKHNWRADRGLASYLLYFYGSDEVQVTELDKSPDEQDKTTLIEEYTHAYY